MTLHRIERADALGPGYRKTFEVAGRQLLLVQGEAGPFVVNAICPHAGARLAEGEVIGNRLRCPGHRFIFDLATGDCARGRREGWGPLPTYPSRLEDGFVCVELA